MRHVLVVHSAGDISYVERLQPAGFRFTLVKKCPTVQDRQCFDRVFDHDYQVDPGRTLTWLEQLHGEDPFDGVVSFSESGVIMAALVAARLGLPGNPPRAALRARDKFLMRQSLRAAGIDSPAFHLVSEAAQVVDHVRAHGGPMVLKPISGSSSYGVTRLDPDDTAADIEAHLADLRRYIDAYRDDNPEYPFEFWLPGAGHGIPANEVHDPARQFLLEGFVGGQQVSVDGFVSQGRVTPCGVIEIERIKNSDYFLEYEEWMPTRLPAAVEERIEQVTVQAVRGLGLSDGAFHCELKVSDDGIVVLEIAGRRGADNIADFLCHVRDVDIYEEAVRIACGEPRHRERTPPRCHMKMRYFLPSASGELVAIEGADAVRRDPRVSELVLDVRPGDPVMVPPEGFEFLGYVSVMGPSRRTAADTLEEVHGAIRFRIEPRRAAAAPAVGNPDDPVPGRLLVVQPSADYAFRVRRHVPDAVFLSTPARMPELSGHTVVAADLRNVDQAVAALRPLLDQGPLDGVTCFVCDHLEMTAAIAAAVDLPYHSPGSVRRSRNKDQSTLAWHAADVPMPHSRFVGGLPDLLDFAGDVAPPWILKPTNRTGSEWVLRVDRRQDLLAAHLRIRDGLTPGDRARSVNEPRYMVQELVIGREVSADLFIDRGHAQALRWTEKHLLQEPGLAGLVGAYFPARLEAAEHDHLLSVCEQAATALGVEHGMVMVDGILRHGRFHVLEMALRPGGDCLPDLSRHASGYDPVRAACQIALGHPPDGARHEPQRIAALHLMADVTGTIARLDLSAVSAHPATVQVDAYRGVGDALRVWAGSYDDRIVAACLVRFDDAAQLPGLVRELSGLIDLDVVVRKPAPRKRRA